MATATLKDLEAKNPLTADGVNKHCLQCGWTYPVPGHAPGCVLLGYVPEPEAPPTPAKEQSRELGKEIKAPKPEVKKED